MVSARGNQAVTVILAFTILAGLIVFFRLFTRVLLLRNAGFDDVCITLAMLCTIGLTVAISEQVQNGMGQHIIELTPEEMVNSLKAFWASLLVYYLGLTFTKLGILIQYFRLFPTPKYRRFCWVLLAFVSTYGIWTLFSSIFLCMPVQFFWNKSIKGTCLNERAVWYTNACVNIVQDLAIIILPIPVVRTLDIPRNQKKALVVVFALGGFVCLVSIIRLPTLVAISNSSDPTFDNPPAAIWSSVETNVGIITACLPSLRPLLAIMMPQYFPASSSRFTGMRSNADVEEPPKSATWTSRSTRPNTAATRPQTAGTDSGQSNARDRTSNTNSSTNGSELGEMFNRQATATYGTGSRVNGPVRQVMISHSRSNTITGAMPPSLPRLPENIATIGSVELDRQKRRSFRNGLGKLKHNRNPSLQKPLPMTPYPINPFQAGPSP